MRYEWDENKNVANQAKHGVPLELAPLLFRQRVVEYADDDEYEARFVAIGLIGGFVFTCVYTDRGDVRRIISLRKATRNEQEDYFT